MRQIQLAQGRVWAAILTHMAFGLFSVVKLLTLAGIPANRLAATGFGDNQPLDVADTPEGYARNRRIELRLTDR